MTATKTPNSAVRVKPAFARLLAAFGVLVLLAACSPSAGGGTEPSSQASQGADGDSGTDDSGSSGSDSDSSGGGDEPIDPCTLIPDDALAAALGSAPSPDRDAGLQLCVIKGTGDLSSRLNIEISSTGRDGFETQRGYKEPIENLYQPLTGIGDDAFAFASEVTVLVGDRVVVLFLEGLAFDDVSPEDRLERTKTLAMLVAEQLG
jgi:hypothetical protein